MKRFIIFAYLLFYLFTSTAQTYDDYLGAGHSDGVTVITSNDFQQQGWDQIASGETTITGAGLEGELMDASRFLAQATFGADEELIAQVAEMGFEEWIDAQMELPAAFYLPVVTSIYDELYDLYIDAGYSPDDLPDRPYWSHFNYGWWELNMTNEDLLRHRVALALSEILVISYQSDLGDFGFGLADYLDIFVNNAFGNFEDILREVALHPTMGFYLSHLNNPKSDAENNVHPDENFAREIMQLFSIGLYELNNDGTRKVDGEGNFIPTYTNSDIKEFAKVFTGLGAGGVVDWGWADYPEFGLEIWTMDMTTPMVMYEEWHEQGEKHLLNGYTIPAGQTGMEDVVDAVNHLFNHPNVGPFISRRLIQSMIKSNPTPEYINRVASVFNDNGEGVRGDMGAVVKAILLDEEARDCYWINDPHQGKLREPILRNAHFARAIDIASPSGKIWNIGYELLEMVGQHPMGSPSVFNFYLPDFQPIGPIADAGLFAPEFQIYNSNTSIGYVNLVNYWAVNEDLFYTWEEIGEFPSFTDYTKLLSDVKDSEALINRLDLLLTHGRLTDRTRDIIKDAIAPLEGGLYWMRERIALATYLIMISPDYAIFK